MSNDSSTGGYLSPLSSSALYDSGLDGQLQALVVGITGLAGTLVLPRWQPVNPKQPTDTTTNWCAIGVTDIIPEQNGSIRHVPDSGNGHDELRQQETIEALCSFYGSGAYANACLMRDGIRIPQNRDIIWTAQMNLIDIGHMTQVPELINQNWRRRVDLPLRLRRMVVRTYPIDDLLEVVGTITNDYGQSESFDTANHR